MWKRIFLFSILFGGDSRSSISCCGCWSYFRNSAVDCLVVPLKFQAWSRLLREVVICYKHRRVFRNYCCSWPDLDRTRPVTLQETNLTNLRQPLSTGFVLESNTNKNTSHRQTCCRLNHYSWLVLRKVVTCVAITRP